MTDLQKTLWFNYFFIIANLLINTLNFILNIFCSLFRALPFFFDLLFLVSCLFPFLILNFFFLQLLDFGLILLGERKINMQHVLLMEIPYCEDSRESTERVSRRAPLRDKWLALLNWETRPRFASRMREWHSLMLKRNW